MKQSKFIQATLSEHQNALHRLLREFDRVCKILNIPYLLFAGTMLGAIRHEGFIPWDDDLDVIMFRRDYVRFMEEAPAVLEQDSFYLQREFSGHWPLFFSKLRLNGTTCLEKYHPKDPLCHQGVYMDIFPLDFAAGSEFGRKLQFYASKVVIAKALYARGYETHSIQKKLFMAMCRILPAAPFLALAKRGNEQSGLVHSFFGAASDYAKNVYPVCWFLERTERQFAGEMYPVSAHYDALLGQLYGEYMRIPPREEREIKRHSILVDLHHSYEEYAHYRDGMEFEVLERSIR